MIGSNGNGAHATIAVQQRRASQLSRAERELVLETIASLKAEGLTNVQIARAIGYGPRTTGHIITTLEGNGGRMSRRIFRRLVEWRKAQGLAVPDEIQQSIVEEVEVEGETDPYAWVDRIEEALLEVIVMVEQACNEVPHVLMRPYTALKQDLEDWLEEHGR